MDIEELKKLPARERLAKIREFEKARKKEIKAAKELARDSQREITEEEIDFPIDQLKALSLETLFTPEEKELFKTKRYVSDTIENQFVEDLEPAEIKSDLDQIAFEAVPLKVENIGGIYGEAIEASKRAQDPIALYGANHQETKEFYQNIPGHESDGSPQRGYVKEMDQIHETGKSKTKDSYESNRIKSKEIKDVY